MSYGVSRVTGRGRKKKHLMLSIFMFPRKDRELVPKTHSMGGKWSAVITKIDTRVIKKSAMLYR